MRLKLLLLFFILKGFGALAQAPSIAYVTPQTYSTGVAITPLLPTNTGGTVPATIYGQVTTFAGSGATGANNGAAATASFDHPYGLTSDGNGNIYIADSYNHQIRKISPANIVSTLAGNGSPGASNLSGSSASFNFPGGVATDAAGNVFVGDQTNNLIRKITPAGLVSTYAGSGSVGYTDGNASSATFSSPAGLTIDALGNLFVADRGNNVIRKITPAGIVSTFAGNGTVGLVNATGTAATFNGCSGITTDQAGNFYVADQYNNTIRKITAAGVVTTLAGNLNQGNANGAGTAASFNQPFGLAVDGTGNVYVADEFNHLIRKITPSGIVNTVAGTGTASSVNGIGLAASFNYPSGIILDGNGNLLINETIGNLIRKMTLTGYAIDKPLPAGLTFDPTTGKISGTPTATSPATNYTITAYNTSGSSSTILNIAVSTPQTINYIGGNNAIATKNYGDTDFPPGASATSGLPVTYTSSNTSVATITAGGNIHIVGAGTTTITALQQGNSTYLPATQVTQTLIVLPVPLTLAAPLAASRIFGIANPVFTITYTGFVNGDDATKLTSQPTISTTATISSLPGTYPITIAGAASPNYTITYVPGVLTITIATRTLTFLPIPPKTYGDADFDPGATLNTTDPIIYTTSDPSVATIINGKVHIVGPGTVTITGTVAPKAGTTNVAPVSQVLVINKAPQVISFSPISPQIIGDPDLTLSVTASSGLPLTLTSSKPGIATISGSFVVKMLKPGIDTLTATQPGDANYLAATAIQVLTILSKNLIPNAFSPNGDNINDTWEIAFLYKYPDCTVQVFSRSGLLVFSSIGYNKAWDGTYKNTVLPVGPYYYIIDLKDGSNTLSGTVNLVK
jgi:gliding motility-associated-like protein